MSTEAAPASNQEAQEQQLTLEQELQAIDTRLSQQIVPTPDEFPGMVETASKIKYLGRDEATKEDTYCDENGTPIDADLAKRVINAAKPETWVLDNAAKGNYNAILAAKTPKDLKSGDPKNKSPLERQYDYFTKHLAVGDRSAAWTYFQGAAQLRLELSDALVAEGATSPKEPTEAEKADAIAKAKEIADAAAAKKAAEKAAQDARDKANKDAADAAAAAAAQAASKSTNHVVPPKTPKGATKKAATSGAAVPPVQPPKGKAAKTAHPDADRFKDIVTIDSRGNGHRNGGKFIKKQNLEMLMSDDIAAKIRDGAADWEKAKADGKVSTLEQSAPAAPAVPDTYLDNDEAFDAAKEEYEDRDRYGVAPSVLNAIENDPNLSATEKMDKLAKLEEAETARKAAEAIKNGRSAADELAIFNKYGLSADQYDALKADPDLTDDEKQAKLDELEQKTALSANRVANDEKAMEAAQIFDKWGITAEQAESILNDPDLTDDEKNAKFAFLAAKQQAQWDAKAAARAAAGDPIPATAIRDMELAHDEANADAPYMEKYGISYDEFVTLNSDQLHTAAQKRKLLDDLEKLTAEKNAKFAEAQAAEIAALTPEQVRETRVGKFKKFFKKIFTKEVEGTDERKVRKGRVAVAAGAVAVAALMTTDLIMKAKTGAGFLPDFFGGFGSGNGANATKEAVANTPDASILNGQGSGAGLDTSLLAGGAEAANNAPVAETAQLGFSGDTIWNESAQYLSSHGYNASQEYVDMLKDAILQNQGLTEAQAADLSVGYAFNIPVEILNQIPKA